MTMVLAKKDPRITTGVNAALQTLLSPGLITALMRTGADPADQIDGLANKLIAALTATAALAPQAFISAVTIPPATASDASWTDAKRDARQA